MSVLILHGIENHRPPGHWQHWLAGELRERGEHVVYPGLPDPDTPSPDAWTAALHGHLAALGHDHGERVVVCHSLACLLWLSAAAGLAPDERVDRVMLVSPPATERLPPTGAAFAVEQLDVAAVRASARAELAITCSDDDPYNPAGAQAVYGDALGVAAHVVRGAGHITPDEGFGAWPLILAWCTGSGARG